MPCAKSFECASLLIAFCCAVRLLGFCGWCSRFLRSCGGSISECPHDNMSSHHHVRRAFSAPLGIAFEHVS